MQTKILIFDDCHIFRHALKLIIESNSDFQVTGEVSNIENLFNFLKTINPNVILISLSSPHNDIINVTKELYEKYPEIPVLILSTNINESFILESLSYGVHGVLRKENTPQQLLEAISKVAKGQRYFTLPEIGIKTKIIRHAYYENSVMHDFVGLSDRETEVLKLFAEGLTYKGIATKLHISPRTVESHKNNILEKLNLNSISDLTKYAIKYNLIEL